MTPRRTLQSVAFRHFQVLEFIQPANLRIPLHFHAEATLLMVVGGEVTDTLGSRVAVTNPGALLLRPAGAPHTHRYGGKGASCITVSMDPEWLAETTGRKLGADIVQARPELSCSRFVRELSINDAVRPLSMESAIAELLALTGRMRDFGGRDRFPGWLRATRDVLHDAVLPKLTLSGLARQAGVHEGHLSRAFRAHFGCSIGQYARAVRIRRAARALIASDRPISDIALDAGFYDQSHFHRVFRTALGCTPRTWRRQHGRRELDARIVQSFPRAR